MAREDSGAAVERVLAFDYLPRCVALGSFTSGGELEVARSLFLARLSNSLIPADIRAKVADDLPAALTRLLAFPGANKALDAGSLARTADDFRWSLTLHVTAHAPNPEANLLCQALLLGDVPDQAGRTGASAFALVGVFPWNDPNLASMPPGPHYAGFQALLPVEQRVRLAGGAWVLGPDSAKVVLNKEAPFAGAVVAVVDPAARTAALTFLLVLRADLEEIADSAARFASGAGPAVDPEAFGRSFAACMEAFLPPEVLADVALLTGSDTELVDGQVAAAAASKGSAVLELNWAVDKASLTAVTEWLRDKGGPMWLACPTVKGVALSRRFARDEGPSADAARDYLTLAVTCESRAGLDAAVEAKAAAVKAALRDRFGDRVVPAPSRVHHPLFSLAK